MLGLFSYIFEAKKEVLVGLSLSVIYITYYLVEAVKKPILICRKGEFRNFLEENVQLLHEHYWPTPWCLESRLQTVVGSLLRTRLLPPLQYRRQILKLSDGGQVALDWAEGAAEAAAARGAARPVLLVLPGLTGDSRADYVRCLAAAAAALGARCVVFNNRGLGGLPLTTPRLYCAVSHADLAEVVEAVGAAAGRGPLLAAGVSLGGLILGQYLAAHGDRAALHAAFVVSSPLDVVKGSECMERPPLNALLSYHMARNLRRTLHSQAILRQAGAGAGAGAEALAGAVRRLAGCLDARPDPAPADDKRPAVALTRVRTEGGPDAFRSRPPNTSRPPSLHVDDFTALHQPYGGGQMNRGMRRGGGVAVSDRGRFASAAPLHAHYRHLRGRGAWEMGAQHFGHFAPSAQYMMGGMGWGGRMQRAPRHRSFMRN